MNEDTLFFAYFYYKVHHQEIHQNIKNWVQNHQEDLLNYFTSMNQCLATAPKKLTENFEESLMTLVSLFDLICSFHLKSKKVIQCIESILFQEEINRDIQLLLFFKLILLKITKNHHPEAYKIVKKYFLGKFDIYCRLLENKTHLFWMNDQRTELKLMLANILRKLNPKDWKKNHWEKRAFQKYKDSFPIPTLQNPLNKSELEKWIFYLNDKLIEFHLWQKLKPEETSLFLIKIFLRIILNF